MSVKKQTATTSEVQAEEVKDLSTSEVEVATLSLDEYLIQANVNPGLVTSFKWEGALAPALMEPKTAEYWALAFNDQSAKVYK